MFWRATFADEVAALLPWRRLDMAALPGIARVARLLGRPAEADAAVVTLRDEVLAPYINAKLHKQLRVCIKEMRNAALAVQRPWRDEGVDDGGGGGGSDVGNGWLAADDVAGECALDGAVRALRDAFVAGEATLDWPLMRQGGAAAAGAAVDGDDDNDIVVTDDGYVVDARALEDAESARVSATPDGGGGGNTVIAVPGDGGGGGGAGVVVVGAPLRLASERLRLAGGPPTQIAAGAAVSRLVTPAPPSPPPPPPHDAALTATALALRLRCSSLVSELERGASALAAGRAPPTAGVAQLAPHLLRAPPEGWGPVPLPDVSPPAPAPPVVAGATAGAAPPSSPWRDPQTWAAAWRAASASVALCGAVIEFGRMASEAVAREREVLDARAELWAATCGDDDAVGGDGDAALVVAVEDAPIAAAAAAACAPRIAAAEAHLRYLNVVRADAARAPPDVAIAAAAVELSGSGDAITAAAASTSSGAGATSSECVVCREAAPGGGGAPGVLECGHRICVAPCLDAWLRVLAERGQPGSCPVCKAPASRRSVHVMDARAAGREAALVLLADFQDVVAAAAAAGATAPTTQAARGGGGAGGGAGSWDSGGGWRGLGIATSAAANAAGGAALSGGLGVAYGTKIAALLRRLATLPRDEAAVAVSSWEPALRLTLAACRSAGVPAAALTGDRQHDREALRAFASRGAPVGDGAVAATAGGAAAASAAAGAPSASPSLHLRLLLIHAAADHSGLDLTAASHLFLLDEPARPGVLAQLRARVHRAGQRRPVFVYHLVARGTVDERLLRRRRAAPAGEGGGCQRSTQGGPADATAVPPAEAASGHDSELRWLLLGNGPAR